VRICSIVCLLHTGREPHRNLVHVTCMYMGTHVPVVHICAFLEHLMVISVEGDVCLRSCQHCFAVVARVTGVVWTQ